MTRKDYYDMISRMGHAHYREYVSECGQAGMEPLSFDDWLATDHNAFPGYAGSKKPPEKASGPDVGPNEPGDGGPKSFEDLLRMVEEARGPAPKAPDIPERKETVRYFVHLADGTMLTGDKAKEWVEKQGWRRDPRSWRARWREDDLDRLAARILGMLL